nr:hypothetical protein [Burkholderiaceae bacterium]
MQRARNPREDRSEEGKEAHPQAQRRASGRAARGHNRRTVRADQTIAVIDFETTGISPGQGARATEVAAVLVRGGR